MNWLGILIYFIIVIIISIVLFAGSWIIATFITGYLNLTGLNWWLANIVIALVIFSLIGGGTSKVTRKE